MIKTGTAEDMDRMIARANADKIRPMDDTSPIRDFPKHDRPLVEVSGEAAPCPCTLGLCCLQGAGEKVRRWS